MSKNRDNKGNFEEFATSGKPVPEPFITPTATLGLVVRYIGIDGRPHEASIASLGQEDRADLMAHVDGRQQTFTGVPYNADGEPNTWDYIPKS
jgi:hypothetical protein